jgi:ribosomal protein S18 acetylase RimI-like enzyme
MMAPSCGGRAVATKTGSWTVSAGSRSTRKSRTRCRQQRTTCARRFSARLLNYSTWTGRNGVYLEDLFVREAERRHGYGRALLKALAEVCVERGYRRLEWSVLDWNEPSIRFYRSIGATGMDEWTVQRLTGDALTRLAAG